MVKYPVLVRLLSCCLVETLLLSQLCCTRKMSLPQQPNPPVRLLQLWPWRMRAWKNAALRTVIKQGPLEPGIWRCVDKKSVYGQMRISTCQRLFADANYYELGITELVMYEDTAELESFPYDEFQVFTPPRRRSDDSFLQLQYAKIADEEELMNQIDRDTRSRSPVERED